MYLLNPFAAGKRRGGKDDREESRYSDYTATRRPNSPFLSSSAVRSATATATPLLIGAVLLSAGSGSWRQLVSTFKY